MRAPSSTDAANPVTISGIKIDTSFNAAKSGFAISVDPKDGNADKYGVGFVASLGKGAVLENLVLEVNYDISDTGADGVLVGGAVGYLCGGTVKNVTVTGSVKNYYRAGGIVGGGYGSILNCTNQASVASTGTKPAKLGYYRVGGIIGYIRVLETSESNTQTLTMTNCKSEGALSSTNANGCGVYAGDWKVATKGGVILTVSGNTSTVSASLSDVGGKAHQITGVDATYEK